MLELPKELIPAETEEFLLPDGSPTSVPKATPIFPMWRGDPIADDWNGKPVLDFHGEPCFAELYILRLFFAAGWSGRWVETYPPRKDGPRCLLSWSDEGIKGTVHHPIESTHVTDLLRTVARNNGDSCTGCWDVIAWKGQQVVAAESKRKDRISEKQRSWFKAGIQAGLSPESFLVVKWTPG